MFSQSRLVGVVCSSWRLFGSIRSQSLKNCSRATACTDSSGVDIDNETIELIERLSLVKFSSEVGIRRLADAVRFADQLKAVDTTGVQPLYSVQENRSLPLRSDVYTETNCQEQLLATAAKLEEEYFVAPLGNVPISVRRKSS